MKLFKRIFIENKILTIVLILILIGSLFTWLFTNSRIQDFGLNFFTEILGVIITVYIIDYLVERREQEKLIPLKITIYKDVLIIYRSIISIFIEAHRSSVPFDEPENLEDFLAKKGMGQVFKYLDLNSKPDVIPERTWLQYFFERRKRILDNSNKFLERYSSYSDPILYNAIHNISNGLFLDTMKMIPTVMNLNQDKEKQFIMSFNSFAVELSEEDYKSLNTINTWMNENHSELFKYDQSLKKVTYKSKYQGKRNTSCKLPDNQIN